MAIAAYHSWGEFIYHLFGTYLLRSVFDRQFRKFVLLVLQQRNNDCGVISGRWTPFYILVCAIDLVDGVQCKFKRERWFVFYASLWTCWKTYYFRLSCELVGWLTISKSQALEIVYPTHYGSIVVGKGKSVSWGGARTKGEVHMHKLTKNMLLKSDLLTSLSSYLTQLFLLLEKSCYKLIR